MLDATAEQRFLKECNGTRTIRVFRSKDYQAYKSALREAEEALRLGEPYFYSEYATFRMPAFAMYCSSSLETAAWAVWVLNGEVRSEYGTRPIKKTRPRMQYTCRSYLRARERREWVSPLYETSEGVDVHIVAVWNVRNGEAHGVGCMGLVYLNGGLKGLTLDLCTDIPDILPSALFGTSWNWPEGTLEQDAEAIVRQRAEEIAEHLHKLKVLDPED